MKAQYTNQLFSSFLLYLDNLLLRNGEAFYNVSGYFYPKTQTYANLYAYSAPYCPVVYDGSISNSIPFTGVYLDNTFITTGQSGLAQINYNKSTLYFTGEITGNNRLSGSFSVAEFSTQFTTDPDYKIIFESKKFFRSKYLQTLTGISENEIPFPTIFIKDNGGYAEPFAFGGEDITYNIIRLIVLGDSQFNTDAVTSLLKDQTNSYIPLLHVDEFPFNNYGGLNNGVFNYTGVVANRVQNGSGVFIEKVQVLAMTQGFRDDLSKLQPVVFPAIADFTLCKPRFTR